jgi:hypothetical protein
MNLPDSQILIYQPEDGKTRIDVRLEDENVWLTQGQMVELFQSSKQNISLHIRNIFSESELQEGSVVKEYLTTAADGKKYLTKYYNLDVIIAVGYRVRSHRGMQFRRGATERLREYLVKGFTMDDERLKNPPGPGVPDYFDEMLERIRDIRSAERRMYLQVRNILALAADYVRDVLFTTESQRTPRRGHAASSVPLWLANADCIPTGGMKVALLDVRNSRLHVFGSIDPALAPLLEGEALSFCRMYGAV